MISLENYTDKELLSILQCNKLHELYDVLNEEKANNLFLSIQALPPIRPIPNKVIQALLVPITDTSSYPLILLGSIIGLVSGGTLSLLISTGIILSTSLILGGFFFYSNYKEMQKKERKINKLLHLYELKNEVADLYLHRKGLQIDLIEIPSYANKNEISLVKTSVRACMLITTSLFGTYFLGLNAAFSALGFSLVSVSMGPVGIIFGLGLALTLGIYFGSRHYQMLKQDDCFKFDQKCQEIIVGKKTNLCKQIKTNEMDLSLVGEVQTTKPIYSANIKTLRNKFSFRLNKLKSESTAPFFKPAQDNSDFSSKQSQEPSQKLHRL